MKKIMFLAIFSFIFLTGMQSLFAQGDVTPPVILSLDFTPKTVDVSGGSQSITVTAGITDDMSGFAVAYVGFFSPSQQQYRTAILTGNAQDGVYQDQLVFPQFSEAGTWHVLSVTLRDNVGNQASFYEADLIAAGFSTELEVQGGPDLAAPQLLEFNFSPGSIDVSGADGTVDVTMRATDNISGFAVAYVGFFSPSQQQYRTAILTGNAPDGVYQAQIVLPRFSEAGTWRVLSITLRDNVGNQASFYEPDLIAAGFPTELIVVSDSEDTSPPCLVEFSFSPTMIDVSGADGTVDVTARITDDISGFAVAYVGFFSPSQQQYRTAILTGNAPDGVYQAQIVLPRFSEAGTWRVLSITLRDNVGNQASFYEPDLIAAGFPTTIQVSTNVPPIANAGPDRTALVGEVVSFDGSGSSDPDGSITGWLWDFGDDATAAAMTVAHTYLLPGQFVVALTVTDQDGGTAVDQALVVVKAPITAVGDLIADVKGSISGNQQKSLLSKLNSVLDSLKKKNDRAAINKLMLFIEEVQSQKGKKIPDDVADRLIALANRIIAAVQAGANALQVSTIDALTRAESSNLLESPGNSIVQTPGFAIRLRIEEPGALTVAITDSKGNLVGLVYGQFKKAGDNIVIWNGRDLQGNPCPKGVYSYRALGSFRPDTSGVIFIR